MSEVFARITPRSVLITRGALRGVFAYPSGCWSGVYHLGDPQCPISHFTPFSVLAGPVVQLFLRIPCTVVSGSESDNHPRLQ